MHKNGLLARILACACALIVVACQPSAALPTLAPSPTVASAALLFPLATPSPMSSPSALLPITDSPTPSPSALLPTNDSPTPSPSLRPTATHTPSFVPTWTAIPPATATATLLPSEFSFGTSAGGLPLLAYRYGVGGRIVLVVGGIHAGYERNTIVLAEALREHYANAAAEIPAGIQLVIVPRLNPDGAQQTNDLLGRFNANGVDLNRNWGCGWSPTAVFRDGAVNPGAAPFSEPESIALGGFIQQSRPAAVIFYHSAARGVFAGNCEGNTSDTLAQVYGNASGYPFGAPFSAYPVTGTAPAWVNSLGIPAVDVELASATDSEFTRNLNAVRAVLAWLASTP